MVKLPDTERKYYIIVNREEYLYKLQDLGYDNVVFMSDGELSYQDVPDFAIQHKGILIIKFEADVGGEITYENDFFWNFPSVMICISRKRNGEKYDHRTFLDKVIEKYPDLDSFAERAGAVFSTDYSNKCGNCHKELEKQDKYCRYCGTKRGMGEYEPYFDVIQILYGPPVVNMYTCDKCGEKWKISMGRADYCPNCGNKCEITEQNSL